jgi:APA family basic amino acid/polyamine antiporter
MSVTGRPPGPRLLIKKSIANIQKEAARSELKRSLGPFNLMSLGVGAIIGAGIFVLTGQVASANAGPAIMLSFIVAGIACALAGLCYAELSSTMPVAGSAYTYAYGTLGEVFAWIMGWLLVLEYGIAAAVVAVGWAGNVVSLLHDFGVDFPKVMLGGSPLVVSGDPQFQWATPLVQAITNASGTSMQLTGTLNLVAATGIALVTGLLVLGVSESAKVNNVIVVIKVLVLIAFVAIGVAYINPKNWIPFIPPNTTGTFGDFGYSGILRGGAIIFFAYVGFEAVSTAAAEAKNPSKDVPIGILGALIICTIIYMAVAAVMTGVVPYKQLGGPAPIAVAIDRMNPVWALVPFAGNAAHQLNLVSVAIKVGAVTGLSSVMLVLSYGQTRIFYTMARDGLLPKVFALIHPKFRTPWAGTLVMGGVIAVAASFLPISLLSDLVSLGTATAFSIVCLSVIYLRVKHPDMHRPFRVPGGVWTAVAGIVACLGLALANLAPMVQHALAHDPLPLEILVGYCIVGAAIYTGYGFWNSKLAKGIDITEEMGLETAVEALGRGVDDRKH